MTISVIAEGDVKLPESIHDELVELALDDVRSTNDNPGKFADCGPEDVDLKIEWAWDGGLHYKLEYTGGSDA